MEQAPFENVKSTKGFVYRRGRSVGQSAKAFRSRTSAKQRARSPPQITSLQFPLCAHTAAVVRPEKRVQRAKRRAGKSRRVGGEWKRLQTPGTGRAGQK